MASSITAYKFEAEQAECEKSESECWGVPFQEVTKASTEAIAGFEAHREGLYNLRVIVETTGGDYQAEVNDQLALQEGSRW